MTQNGPRAGIPPRKALAAAFQRVGSRNSDRQLTGLVYEPLAHVPPRIAPGAGAGGVPGPEPGASGWRPSRLGACGGTEGGRRRRGRKGPPSARLPPRPSSPGPRRPGPPLDRSGRVLLAQVLGRYTAVNWQDTLISLTYSPPLHTVIPSGACSCPRPLPDSKRRPPELDRLGPRSGPISAFTPFRLEINLPLFDPAGGRRGEGSGGVMEWAEP